jgi:hypothetical protein
MPRFEGQQVHSGRTPRREQTPRVRDDSEFAQSLEEAQERTRQIGSSLPRVSTRPPVNPPSRSVDTSAAMVAKAREKAGGSVRITNNISVSSASARSSYATLSRVTSFGRTPASNSLWNLR